MPIVIVAIPESQDVVWKVSSEKVPHMTLMYLGEDLPADQLERIVQFVEHVTSVTLCRFGMDVDKRDILGPKDADVLLFKRSAYNMKTLKDTLSYFMSNNDIFSAYSSVVQYPEWTPHLTLGYPETPANEDKVPEFGINWVSFDRIAVWTGDFDGPEFELKDRWEDTADVAWSELSPETQAAVDKVLSHHGVKGQRWGFRRTPQQLARSKSVSDLSDSELQAAVNRLRLEKEFASLSSPSAQATAKKGESFIKSTATSILKDNITKIAKAQTAHLLSKALEKSGQKHLADAVNPPKKEKKSKGGADTPKPHNQTSTPPRSRPMSTVPRIVPNPAYRRSSRAAKIYDVTTLGRN